VAIRDTHLSVVCQNRVKSITSPFTSTIPLFAAPYLLNARLYSVKPIRGGFLGLNSPQWSQFVTPSRDTFPLGIVSAILNHQITNCSILMLRLRQKDKKIHGFECLEYCALLTYF
jgi:hypothetical protein